MRFSFSAIAFAASLALVSAQDLGNIPSCALTCFAAAVPASGCSLTDTACQCTTGKDSITKSITTCAPQKCSSDDVAKIAPAVAALCQKAGVTVSNLPTAVPSGASTASGASASRTSSGAAQQTGNSAAVHGVGLGAAALGMAALIAL